MILLIDNYDSFVHNLARYFERLGQEVHVVRNDAIDAATVQRMAPAAVVLSPGPCAPAQAGACLSVVAQLHAELPMLGVCLGHQVIAEALGGGVVRAAEPRHGRASLVEHDGHGLFAGVPNPFPAGRYHSLVVDESSLPDDLRVTAGTADGVVMALAHRRWPVYGVQFHPESILTEPGFELLANFLRLARIPCPAALPTRADELPVRTVVRNLPAAPVTF